MSEQSLIDILTSYKRTCALLAALELKIFDKLLKKPIENGELAEVLEADKEMLECFMNYLREEDLVNYEDGAWHISESFTPQATKISEFANIIKHEKNIYKNWITPEVIVSSIQSKNGDRKFDVEGLKSEDNEDYCKAMYGKNLNLIAFYIQRKLNGMPTPINYLEYGRSYGELGIVLQKKIPEVSVYLAIDDTYLDIFKQTALKRFLHPPERVQGLKDFEYTGQYDFIYIMNTIHYYKRSEALDRLHKLRKLMHKDSILCICDLFNGNHDRFNSTLLIDWITHGGIYNLSLKSVIDMLNEVGFTNISHKFLREISTDLIFAL
ncbi:MAG: methyltransferase family protein [Clostridia bacterium]